MVPSFVPIIKRIKELPFTSVRISGLFTTRPSNVLFYIIPPCDRSIKAFYIIPPCDRSIKAFFYIIPPQKSFKRTLIWKKQHNTKALFGPNDRSNHMQV